MPPGRRHIAVSVQLRINSVPNGERRLWLHGIFRKKGSLETLVSSASLVTFSAAEMSEVPPVADEASEFRGSAPLVATNGKQEAAGATVPPVSSLSKGKRRNGVGRLPAARRRRNSPRARRRGISPAAGRRHTPLPAVRGEKPIRSVPYGEA